VHASEALHGKLGEVRMAPPERLVAMQERGQLGRKTGEGFYRWVEGKPQKSAPQPVPAGLSARLIDPLVAEAQKALAEGVVSDADLVDAGAIFGAGFAPFRGGPLFYAAHLGRPAPGG
jgi:3-hydroxyacyl-CoA dehydrogenase / enoyl-CoA hydratase / 3-hydroxybutyryl-CoA epimerase